MKSIKQNIAYWLGIIIFGAILGVSLQFVRAWTEPTVAPPGGNVGAPINTSSIGQSKTGGVILNCGTGLNCAYNGSSATNGLIVANGNVGIGTIAPTQALDVNGQIHASGDICTDAGGNHQCLSNLSNSTISNLLIGAAHSTADCTNAGGTLYNGAGGTGRDICEFNQSSCPSNWAPYLSWTATKSNTCYGDGLGGSNNSCTTGQHNFSNKAVESCSYQPASDQPGLVSTCSANLTRVGCI